MPNSRQLDEGVLVRSFGVTFNLRAAVPPTSETWDQLVYAIKGVVTVKTEAGTWVVPPHRAVWLPAGTTYSLEMSGRTALRMIYLPSATRAAATAGLDRTRCSVLSVSPLLRELIVRTAQIGALESANSNHRLIAGLIEDELQSIATVPLQLPYPRNPVARRFASQLDSRLGAPMDLVQTVAECGASRRTLERIFRDETGMSLGQWVRRRKLLIGLELVLDGSTIGSVAFGLGYSTPSAFIAMFKRELGTTPGDYLGKD